MKENFKATFLFNQRFSPLWLNLCVYCIRGIAQVVSSSTVRLLCTVYPSQLS